MLSGRLCLLLHSIQTSGSHIFWVRADWYPAILEELTDVQTCPLPSKHKTLLSPRVNWYSYKLQTWFFLEKVILFSFYQLDGLETGMIQQNNTSLAKFSYHSLYANTFLDTAYMRDIRSCRGGKGRDFQIQVVWFNILPCFLYRSKEIPCIPVHHCYCIQRCDSVLLKCQKSPQGRSFLDTDYLTTVKKKIGKAELTHSISTFKAVYSELSYQYG